MGTYYLLILGLSHIKMVIDDTIDEYWFIINYLEKKVIHWNFMGSNGIELINDPRWYSTMILQWKNLHLQRLFQPATFDYQSVSGISFKKRANEGTKMLILVLRIGLGRNGDGTKTRSRIQQNMF